MLLFVLNLLVLNSILLCSGFEMDLLMPNVAPTQKDSYICHKFKMDQEAPIYITEFQPQSKKEIAHHMLLFGCENVVDDDVWNCGEMQGASDKDAKYKPGPVCNGGEQSIIYAWAMDAPKLVLPKDVAFKLGGNTNNKYLVLQVHYANVDTFLNGETDKSGIKMIGQHESLPNRAGVYLLETGGKIKSKAKEYFEAACRFTENLVMHPFAYRTHAHKLGVVNSGYVIKTNSLTGKQEWIEIGRRSPQLPQMFFPVSNEVEVKKGDILAARCSMYNFRSNDVSIGPTGNDEMCNFYIMYYVKGDKPLSNNICFTPGPPRWHFESFKELDTSGMPSEISSVPKNQIKQLAEMNEKEMHMASSTGSSGSMNHGDMSSSEENDLFDTDKSVKDGSVNLNYDMDEYEAYLNELEKEYNFKKLLRKYLKTVRKE